MLLFPENKIIQLEVHNLYIYIFYNNSNFIKLWDIVSCSNKTKSQLQLVISSVYTWFMTCLLLY